MANVYCAIYGDSDYWDGTIAWGYDATSDKHNPTAHPNEAARDAQYTAAYTSLSAWEAARGGVAQSADTEYAMIQTPWDADDTVLVNLTFTNTPTIIVRAIGDARHAGVWDDGASSPHRLVAANAALAILRISISDVTVDGMQIYNTEAVDSSNNCLYSGGGAYTGLRFSNLILVSENAEGIRLNNPGLQVKLWNIIIYCPDGGGQEGLWIDAVSTCEFYNSTIEGFYEGVEIDAISTSCLLKNNVVFNNTDDINDGIGVTIDYNASDDGDGTNAQDFTAEATDWNKVFTDYANNDYSLKDYTTSPCCVGKGVDNPGAGLYSVDIKGETRTSIWDIGAFEYPAEGGEEFIRSIADTIELTDTLIKATGKGVALADTIGITDMLATVGTFMKSISDSVNISDILSTLVRRFASLSDLIGITDALSKLIIFKRSVIDNIGIVDILLRSVAFIRSIFDSLSGGIWTQKDSSFGTDIIYGIAYNDSDLWVAVGGNGKLATSPNGIDWIQRDSKFGPGGSGYIYGVAHNGLDLWVAVGDSGKIATSPNGIDWTLQTSSFESTNIRSIAYNGSNLWVATGYSGKLATSPDGEIWEQRTSSFDSDPIYGIAHNGSDLWVAVGNNGKLATSSDGETWTQQTSSFGTTRILAIAYNSNLWVAVGNSGKLATSPDGETWEQQTSSFDITIIRGIAYNGSDLWIAVGHDGKLAIFSGVGGIGITDSLSKSVTFTRSIADNVGMADVLSKLGIFVRSIVDTISVSDILITIRMKIRKIINTIGITDILKGMSIIKRIMDSFRVSNIVQSIKYKKSKINKVEEIIRPTINEVRGIKNE